MVSACSRARSRSARPALRPPPFGRVALAASLAASVAALAAAGCAEAPDPIVFEPEAWTAPDARPDYTSSGNVTLVNNTGSSYQLTALNASSDDEDEDGTFSALPADGSMLPLSLGAGESLDVLLVFAPRSIAEYQATLTAELWLAEFTVGGGGCSQGCGGPAPSDAQTFAFAQLSGRGDAEADFEDCADGEDNDGDELTDCEDPDCATFEDCIPGAEDCENGKDDDGDGAVDCDDGDCQDDPACDGGKEDCDDGLDNDGDGLVDCDDADCILDPDCGEIEGCDPSGTVACGDEFAGTTEGDSLWDSYCGNGPGGGGPGGGGGPPGPGWTGPEDVWAFFAEESGNVTVRAGSDFDLDLTILFGEQSPDGTVQCDPELCVAVGWGPGNNESAQFFAEAGQLYFFVVDGWDGAGGDYDMEIVCEATDFETDCGNGVDDDGDGLWDCEDPDCAFDPLCGGVDGYCLAQEVLDCFIGGVSSSNDTWSSTNAVQDWCGSGFDGWFGPEVAYFFSPQSGGTVTVDLDGLSADLDLTVLQGDLGAPWEQMCNPQVCVAQDWQGNADPEHIEFEAIAGEVYFIAVDGWDGAISDFTLTLSCEGGGFEFECADGADNDGDGLVDCDDPDCFGQPDCFGGTEICNDSTDNDGDGLIDCEDILDCNVFCDYGDGDCCVDNGSPGCDNEGGEDCVCAVDPYCCQVTWDAICATEYEQQCGGTCGGGNPETDCADGADNDNDGLVDCADADCSLDPACILPGFELDCGNLVDDDFDGAVDCADPDCAFDPSCIAPGFEFDCSNGFDDDFDGDVDCDDVDCAFDPSCIVVPPESDCDNNLDDDGDGLFDCADPDCAADPVCNVPGVETNCANGLDDDGDALVDCDDPDCVNDPNCNVIPFESQCQDGLDNDLDGDVDCDDSDCASHAFCNLPNESDCDNGIDDDSDSYTDCFDPDCAFDPNCADGENDCDNGIDDDGDGDVDCDDADCSADVDCVDPGFCNPVGNLSCGDVVNGSNTMAGSTDVQDVYCGYNPGGWTGPEVSWVFTPDFDGIVEITLYGLTEDLDIQALSSDNGCDQNDCVANGWNPPPQPEQMDWFAFAGEPYFILIDGWQGAESNFTMAVTCTPVNEQDCGDGVDDDGDGDTDCEDTDCLANPACPELDCENGVDDDADGQTDCNDPDCFGIPTCIPETNCVDGIDNDGDTVTDCEDPDCALATVCQPETACADGLDNDGDGDADCADQDCAGLPICNTTGPEICGNGLDDDGDGDEDCFDNDCAGDPSCDAETDCDNNFDDDADGDVDCDDTDCLGQPGCPVLLFSSVDDDALDFLHLPLGSHSSSTIWEQGVPNSSVQSGSGPNAPYAGSAAWCTGCAVPVVQGGRFNAVLLAQPLIFDLSPYPSGSLVLSFHHWQVSPGLPFVDLSYVVASPDGGATNNNEWGPTASSTGGWDYVELDLSGYLGGPLTFGFRYDSLTGFGGGSADGWYIDDVELIWYP